MNLKWNISVENDLAAGNVGVVVTAATDGVMIKELLPPNAARQLAAGLLHAAEQVAPTAPVPPAPAVAEDSTPVA